MFHLTRRSAGFALASAIAVLGAGCAERVDEDAAYASTAGASAEAVRAVPSPITRLFLTTRDCPTGYEKYPVDLNKDARGEYIFICYTREGPDPIYDLALTRSASRAVATSAVPPWQPVDSCCSRYMDLNAGAGGDYVFLWYSRSEMYKPINRHDPGSVRDIFVRVNDQAVPEGYWGPIDRIDMNAGAGGAYLFLYALFAR